MEQTIVKVVNIVRKHVSVTKVFRGQFYVYAVDRPKME